MEGRGELQAGLAGLLQEILAETERQGRQIAEGDLDGLCASLEARQLLMDRVDSLGGAGARGAQHEAMLRRIAALDAENREKAKELARGLTSGLKQAGAQRSMLAYVSEGRTGGKFVDKEG